MAEIHLSFPIKSLIKKKKKLKMVQGNLLKVLKECMNRNKYRWCFFCCCWNIFVKISKGYESMLWDAFLCDAISQVLLQQLNADFCIFSTIVTTFCKYSNLDIYYHQRAFCLKINNLTIFLYNPLEIFDTQRLESPLLRWSHFVWIEHRSIHDMTVNHLQCLQITLQTVPHQNCPRVKHWE